MKFGTGAFGATTQPNVFTMMDEVAIFALPDPPYLVHGVIPQNAVGGIIGAWGTAKTFVALDLSLCIANGIDWHGRATKQGAICYVAGEGGGGFKKRIKAWRKRFARQGTKPSPFFLIRTNINLLDDADVAKLITTIKDAAARYGITFKLIVIDTVSRALAGADEDAANFSKLIFASETVKEAIGNGASVLLVHHKGKDKDRGGRGSSVFEANADFLLDLDRPNKETKPDEVVLKVIKLKDDADGEKIDLFCHRTVTDQRPDGGNDESLYLLTAEEETSVERKLREEGRKPPKSRDQEYHELRMKILASGLPDGCYTYTDIKERVFGNSGSGSFNAKLKAAMGLDEKHSHVVDPCANPVLIRAICRKLVAGKMEVFEISTGR